MPRLCQQCPWFFWLCPPQFCNTEEQAEACSMSRFWEASRELATSRFYLPIVMRSDRETKRLSAEKADGLKASGE